MGEKSRNLNTYEIEVSKKEGFESEAEIRNFTLTSDDSGKLGGNNKGPTPVEYLLASLGTCLEFTGNLVADQMGHELEDFNLKIEGDLDPRGVMGKADVPVGYQDIRVKISEIEGIPEEDIQEFLETVMERCPVDNSLENEVEVEFER